MITRYRNFEEMLDAAQKAIDKHFSGEQSIWLQKLLDILKDNKFASIQTKSSKIVDVSKIAHTYTYLSFFDVVNDINHFNTSIEPIEIEQLKNPLTEDLYN